MAIQSANAAVFKVTRIAGLSIIQLYFASILLLLYQAHTRLCGELRGLRRNTSWPTDHLLQLYTGDQAKGSVDKS